MALIKKRPKLKLYLPPRVTPGSLVDARLVIEATRPVPARAITVRLVGEERAAVGSGKSRTSSSHVFMRQRAEPRSPGKLSGKKEIVCQFKIPGNAPPSFRGANGAVAYTIEARVDIPWWPDAKQSWELVVGAPQLVADDAPPRPVRFSSAPAGPKGREPVIDASLASVEVAPGESIDGAIALANVEDHRYRAIQVSLVGRETCTIGRRTGQADVARYRIELPAAELDEGQSVPFSMRVPEAIAPSFAASLVALGWYLEIRAVIRLGFDLEVRVALTVVEPTPARKARPRARLAPPSIGTSRLRELWSAVGTRVGLELDGERLVGNAGGTRVSIRRDYRGAGGTFLVAELRYPTLELGLKVSRAGPLGALVRRKVQLGVRGWDKDHYIESRDAEQGSALLLVLRQALARFDVPHLDDDDARVERRGGGREADELTRFCEDVLRLAGFLGAGRPPLPVPLAMRAAEPAWRALAERLGVRLSTAAMAVAGRFADLPVSVRIDWHGAFPVATRFELRPPFVLDVAEPLRLAWEADTAMPPPEPSDWSDERLALYRRVVAGARAFTAAADSLAVETPGPSDDSESMLSRLEALLALARALRRGAGVYR